MGTFGQQERRVLRPNNSGKIENDRAKNGVCGNCRFAFRPNPAQLYKMGLMNTKGLVSCGKVDGAYRGDVITDPYGMGCGKWMPRLQGQPGIGDPRVHKEREFNINLVRKAELLNAEAKLMERRLRKQRIEEGTAGEDEKKNAGVFNAK